MPFSLFRCGYNVVHVDYVFHIIFSFLVTEVSVLPTFLSAFSIRATCAAARVARNCQKLMRVGTGSCFVVYVFVTNIVLRFENSSYDVVFCCLSYKKVVACSLYICYNINK